MSTKVTVNTETNKVIINSEPAKVVTINQPSGSKVVKVITQGPKGDKGDPGEISGTFTGVFNITGSLIVSGGNINGTSSYAINSDTASYLNPLTQSVNLSGSLLFSGGSKLLIGDQGTHNIDLVAGPSGWSSITSNNYENFIYVTDNAAYIETNFTTQPRYLWSFLRDGRSLIPGNVFLTQSLFVSESVRITGSLFVQKGITGSLHGTASWAENVALSNISGTRFNDTTYTFLNDVVIEGNLTAQQLIISSSVYYVTTSFSSGSTIFGNSLDDTHQFTGSVNISGGLVVNDLDILNISIFRQTGSFWATTNNLQITGSTNISGNLVVNGIVSGNFFGNGDNISFNRIGTSQSAESELVIGNWFNNYQFLQTTTFRNSNVIISGNLSIQSGSVLQLGATTIPPTPVTGGIYYHLNDGYYVSEI